LSLIAEHPEYASIILTGDFREDMSDYGDNSDIAEMLIKKEVKNYNWDAMNEYWHETARMIGVDYLKNILDSGIYKGHGADFISLLENYYTAKNNGMSRNYGAEKIQEIFSDYDYNDEQLNKALQDSYELSKIDWEMPYGDINKQSVSDEADHISREHEKNPMYRHD